MDMREYLNLSKNKPITIHFIHCNIYPSLSLSKLIKCFILMLICNLDQSNVNCVISEL